jgi:hypothetical protein
METRAFKNGKNPKSDLLFFPALIWIIVAFLKQVEAGIKRVCWRSVSMGFMAMILPEAALSSDLIEFTNKVATFTNLQGEVLRQVVLVRGDLDGVIWRNAANGGRVCYTNLQPALLEVWGIPTNRIDSARARAAQKALAAAKYQALAAADAQAVVIAKAKEDAEWQARALTRALSEQKKSDLEAIESLELQIERAKTQMRRAQAIAHDYNQANAFNRSAPHVYIKDTERAKIKEAEAQLKRMKREFALKYGRR